MHLKLDQLFVDIFLSAVNIKHRRFVVFRERIIEVVRDEARLANLSVTDEDHLDFISFILANFSDPWLLFSTAKLARNLLPHIVNNIKM